jgi:hypothetical protein
MSDVRLIGIESIRMGVAGESTLATIQYIVPDSAHLIIDPPSATELNCDDTEFPDIEIIAAGKKTVEFATRDMGTSIMLSAFGGTVTTATTDGVWEAPRSATVINEKGFELISKPINNKQLKFEIPRASLRSGADLRFTKTESGQVTFSASVLLPDSGAPIKMSVLESA